MTCPNDDNCLCPQCKRIYTDYKLQLMLLAEVLMGSGKFNRITAMQAALKILGPS